MRLAIPLLLLTFGPAGWAMGQSSSLFRAYAQRQVAQAATTTQPTVSGAIRTNAGTATSAGGRPRNAVLAAHSLTAVTPPEPAVLQVHDHIGVIVRHRYRAQSDAKLEQSSEWDVAAKLDAWFRIHDRKWQQQALTGGKPEVSFKNKNDLENEGKAKRTDILETRLMGEVLDVKPNGNLFIAAVYQIGTGEDTQRMVLTGDVNRHNVNADGTVTSDKIANLYIDTSPEGSIADAIKRGWLKKALDAVKPF
jgi:flagellar basal body L-ring protein FlgH